jgi:hypothetical protein
MTMNGSWYPWSIPVHEGLRNGLYCLRYDLNISNFFPHHSNALLQVLRLIISKIILNGCLHAGSLVSCHRFLSLFFSFCSLSNPRSSWFSSESLTTLVANRYAEAMEEVNSRAALSASTPRVDSCSR